VSYLTGKPLADKAHISTSKTYSQQRDYRFDMKTFTELKNAQSITLAYDGLNPLPPMFCYLNPTSTMSTNPTFANWPMDNSNERIRADSAISSSDPTSHPGPGHQ
jgi:hypothetical protein